MRDSIVEGILFILGPLGLKAIATEVTVLHFTGCSCEWDQPTTGGTNPISQAKICSGSSLRAVKALWNAEMEKSAHLSNSKIKLNQLTSTLT